MQVLSATSVSAISRPLFWSNESEARRVYRQKAELGDMVSLLCLANSYDPQFSHTFCANKKLSQFHLSKCKESIKSLLQQLKELHDARDSDATFNLAFCHLRDRRYRQGVNLLHDAVLNGHIRATYLLSVCIGEGIGTPQNPRRSIYHCHQAARHGHDVATVAYAHSNLTGVNVAFADIAVGEAYYWKAIENGCVEAMLELARFYEWGLFVPQNKGLSLYLYKKAAIAGSGYPI